MIISIVKRHYLYIIFFTLFSANTSAVNLYSFKVSINWNDSITIEDSNSVPTGIKEGTFSFSELLTINPYLVDGHAISESAQFPDVTFSLKLPAEFKGLGCNISFVENSPSPLYIYKRGERFTMTFSQGYSAFHGQYKVLCY